HYLEGGAEDEWTMRRNTDAFTQWALAQNTLVDVSNINAAAALMGFQARMPLMLSPTGMSRLFHRHESTNSHLFFFRSTFPPPRVAEIVDGFRRQMVGADRGRTCRSRTVAALRAGRWHRV
ncbi:MAG: hypothetical protein EOO83_01190, partial [Oxalobacteraceae bacterium]